MCLANTYISKKILFSCFGDLQAVVSSEQASTLQTSTTQLRTHCYENDASELWMLMLCGRESSEDYQIYRASPGAIHEKIEALRNPQKQINLVVLYRTAQYSYLLPFQWRFHSLCTFNVWRCNERCMAYSLWVKPWQAVRINGGQFLVNRSNFKLKNVPWCCTHVIAFNCN